MKKINSPLNVRMIYNPKQVGNNVAKTPIAQNKIKFTGPVKPYNPIKVKNIVKTFLTILLFITCSYVANGQSKDANLVTYGIGGSTSISGCGHGTFYSGYVFVDYNKTMFSIGPCMQKGSNLLKSLKFNCSYKIADSDGMLQLSVFSYLQYMENLPVSFSTLQTEERAEVRETNKTDWSKVRLNTLEMGTGIELGIRFGKNLMMRNFIALSGFYHTSYVDNMFSNRMAPVLMLGTSINLAMPK